MASGSSSTSWPASVVAVSKSGSSSSGGTSTTVLRLPGPGVAVGADGRLGITGFTRGGSGAAVLPAGWPSGLSLGTPGRGAAAAGEAADFLGGGGGALGGASMLPSSTRSASSSPLTSSAVTSGAVGSSSAIGSSSRSAGFSSSRSDGVAGLLALICPKSDPVVSSPSSMSLPILPPPGASSTRLVLSISSDSSGSGTTS